jgi:cobalamin biosynthesis protein CbiD
MADFFHSGLRLAVKHGFKTIGLSEFFGKAVKQAAGYKYTHAHHHDLDLTFLVDKLPDLSLETRELITSQPTALAALEAIKDLNLLHYVPLVAQMVLDSARNFTGAGPKIWVAIFDFDGQILAYETSET